MEKARLVALFLAIGAAGLAGDAKACVSIIGDPNSKPEPLKSFKVYRHRFDQGLKIKSICGSPKKYGTYVSCRDVTGRPPYIPGSANETLRPGQERSISRTSTDSVDATCKIEVIVEDGGRLAKLDTSSPAKNAPKIPVTNAPASAALEKKINDFRASVDKKAGADQKSDAAFIPALRKIQDLHRKCDIAGNASIDNGFTIDGNIVQFSVWDPTTRQTVLMTFNRQDIGAIDDRSESNNLMFAFSCKAGASCVSANGQKKRYAPLMRTIFKCSAQDLDAYKNLLRSGEFQGQFGIKPQIPDAGRPDNPPVIQNLKP